jgi:hypothetical protein
VTLRASAGDLTEVEGRLLPRAALGPAGHAVWTSLATAVLWWALGALPAVETARAGCGSRDLAGRRGSAHSVGCTHAWFGSLFIGLFRVAVLLGLFRRASC